MSWTKFLLVAGASLAAAIPFNTSQLLEARNTGTCSSDQFVAVQSSGTTSIGSPFCETGWGTNYIPVTGISAYATNIYVTGIVLHYADGSASPLYGTTSGSTSSQTISVDYSKGETWKSIVMTSHTDPNTLNTLDVVNSAGTEMYAGASQAQFAGQGVQTNQPVGSGILFGAMGYSDGTSVRDLGFLFLASPIASIAIDSIEYPDGPNGSEGINIESIASGHYYNEQTDQNIGWQFQNSKMVTNTFAFAQATAYMYGESETIHFGLDLKIISISSNTEFTWSTTYTDTSTNTVAQADTVTWQASGTLAPGQGVDCIAEVGTSSGSFPYTSTVTINLQNGYQFTYPENGQLTVNDVSQAVTLVSSDNNP